MSNPAPASKSSGDRRRRACPANGGFISPADCGANRGSRLNCPADCPFFPFGTHPAAPYTKVATAWFEKLQSFLRDTDRYNAIAAQSRNLCRHLEDEGVSLLFAVTQTAHDCFYIRRDAAGRTLADTWAAAQWRGLNNDERLLAGWQRNSRPTALEVETIELANSTMFCRDLLDPDRPLLRLVGDEIVSDAVRFSRMFGWVDFLPYCCRMRTPLVRLTFTSWPAWRTALEQRWQAARGADPQLSLNQYLRTHFTQESAQILQLMDAEDTQSYARDSFVACFTSYRLTRGRAPVEAILDTKPELDRESPEPGETPPPGTTSLLWRCEGESAAFLADPASRFAFDPVLAYPHSMGHLRLSGENLLLSGLGMARQTFTKRLLEQWLGELIERVGDRAVNVGGGTPRTNSRDALLAQVAQDVYGPSENIPEEDDVIEEDDEDTDDLEGDEDEANLPGAGTASSSPAPEPGTAESSTDANSRIVKAYTRFLETPFAVLEGCTPRAAAHDPARRPLLIELMKEHLRQSAERRNSLEDQQTIDRVIAELGLEELRTRPGTPP